MIHLLQVPEGRPWHTQERGVSGLATAALATPGAGSSVSPLPMDAIATALLASMVAAKLRCSITITGTGAVAVTTLEYTVIATTVSLPCIANPGRSHCVR